MKRLLTILLFLLALYTSQSQTYYSKLFAIDGFRTITKNFFCENNTIFVSISTGDTIVFRVRTGFLTCDLQGNQISYRSYRPENCGRYIAPYGGQRMIKLENNFLAVGFAEPDTSLPMGLVMKINAQGDTLQTKLISYANTYSGGTLSHVSIADNSDFISVGFPYASITPPDPYDLWVYRMDSLMQFEWQKIIHVGDLLNYPESIHSLPNGDILVTGIYFNTGVGVQANNHVSSTFMVVLDSLGEALWHYIDPDPNANAPVFFPTSDGGFISCGSYRYEYEMPYTERFKPYIVKWNANLEKEWERYDYISDGPYPHTASEYVGIFENPDGTFLAYGSYESGSGLLTKIDAQGDELWSKYFANRNPNGGWYGNEFTDAQTLPDGSIMVLGNVTDYDGFLEPGQQGWLLHLTANGCLPTPDDDCILTALPPDHHDPPKLPPHDSLSVAVAPTLVTDAVHVLVSGLTDTLGLSVQVFNALGQLVLTDQSITQSDTNLPANNWPSGTYAVVLRLRGQVYRVVKVVKM